MGKAPAEQALFPSPLLKTTQTACHSEAQRGIFFYLKKIYILSFFYNFPINSPFTMQVNPFWI